MNHPRLALYGSVGPAGEPFILPDGSVDPLAIARHARFDVVVLEPIIQVARPDVWGLLREANPDTRYLAFSNGSMSYFNPARSMGCPELDLRGKIHAALSALPNGFLWSARYPGCWFDPEREGPHAPGLWSHFNVNLADVAAVNALAALYISEIIDGGWDGLFLDYFSTGIGTKSANDVLDGMRALGTLGPANVVDFDAAYLAGHRALVTALRAAASVDFLICGNGGQPDPLGRPFLSGWMYENFPAQNGGTWDSNMAFVRADVAAGMSCGWLNMRPDVDSGGALTVAGNERAARFGLASACMVDGCVMSLSRNDRPASDGREALWFPEYSVDRATATPTGDASRKHWLGRARSDALPAGVCWRRDFDYGAVIVNPTDQPWHFGIGASVRGAFHLIGYPGDRRSKAERAVTSVTVPACDAVWLVR